MKEPVSWAVVGALVALGTASCAPRSVAPSRESVPAASGPANFASVSATFGEFVAPATKPALQELPDCVLVRVGLTTCPKTL